MKRSHYESAHVPASHCAAGCMAVVLMMGLCACQADNAPSAQYTPPRKTFAAPPSAAQGTRGVNPQSEVSESNSNGDEASHGTSSQGSSGGASGGGGSGSGAGTGTGNGNGSGASSAGSTGSGYGSGGDGLSSTGGLVSNLPAPSVSPGGDGATASSSEIPAWAAAVTPPKPASSGATAPTPAKADPIPEPPKRALADELEEKLRGVTIAAPKIDIPDTKSPADPAKPGANLIGSWVQADHLGSPDFSDGGYTSRTLIFQASGTLVVWSSFDKEAAIKGARSFRWSVTEAGKLQIEPVPGKGNNATNVEFTLGDAAVTPATIKVPATLDYKISQTNLTLSEKSYKKQ